MNAEFHPYFDAASSASWDSHLQPWTLGTTRIKAVVFHASLFAKCANIGLLSRCTS